MQAVVQAGDAGIVAVNGQQILRQVVRAYRDKINPAGKMPHHKDHRRDFNHHTDTGFGQLVTEHFFHFTPGTVD